MKKMLSVLLGIFLQVTILSAQAPEVEMADTMRADGKIYVVVAAVLVIFAGLLIYLISLDRKISKIEKEISNK